MNTQVQLSYIGKLLSPRKQNDKPLKEPKPKIYSPNR